MAALASRLALFLTNSAPDATLRARAAKGELRNPKTLRSETERLLQDPKSRGFVDGFLDYWLELRKHDVAGACEAGGWNDQHGRIS